MPRRSESPCLQKRKQEMHLKYHPSGRISISSRATLSPFMLQEARSGGGGGAN